MFLVFWKFPPSGTSSCFVSHSFNKDTLPQAARRGPISHQFKHDHDIPVPHCLHRKPEQSAERIPPASLLLQMSSAVFMCIYKRCRIPRTWKVQVMAQRCRAVPGQSPHSDYSTGSWEKAAGTRAAENSWEAAKLQQAQNADGQQLIAFTEVTLALCLLQCWPPLCHAIAWLVSQHQAAKAQEEQSSLLCCTSSCLPKNSLPESGRGVPTLVSWKFHLLVVNPHFHGVCGETVPVSGCRSCIQVTQSSVQPQEDLCRADTLSSPNSAVAVTLLPTHLCDPCNVISGFRCCRRPPASLDKWPTDLLISGMRKHSNKNHTSHNLVTCYVRVLPWTVQI